MRLRNLPRRATVDDLKKRFTRPIETIEVKGQEGRVCFKGNESDAVKFHEMWNGKGLGDRRLEMMIDWQDKQS
jgi:hypothetical protein